MHLIGYLSLFPFSFYIHMTSGKNNKTLNAFSHGKNDGSATFFFLILLFRLFAVRLNTFFAFQMHKTFDSHIVHQPFVDYLAWCLVGIFANFFFHSAIVERIQNFFLFSHYSLVTCVPYIRSATPHAFIRYISIFVNFFFHIRF